MNIFSSFKIGTVGRVRCENLWKMDLSWSERLADCDLFYIWAGTGRMQLREYSVELRPGICIWMRPGGKYTAEHDPSNPLGVTYIHFIPFNEQGHSCLNDDALPGEYYEVFNPVFFSVVSEKIVNLHRRIYSIPKHEDTEFQISHLQLNSLLQALILELQYPSSRQISPYHELIEKQIAKIYEQPGQSDSVSELASELSISKDHYTRVFRSITGCSPREFIQQARFDRACMLLNQTSLTASEIADQLGFSDLYQFSRLFKRRSGMAPSLWRTKSNPFYQVST